MAIASSDTCALKLPEILDRAAVTMLLREVTGQLQAAPPISLDGSGVSSAALPGVQLMLAAVKHHAVSIINASDALVQAFSGLGIVWDYQAPVQPGDAAKTPDVDQIADFEQTDSGEAAMTKRVLTIDDSKTMRDMLMLTLSSAGFEVIQAVDGQEGVETIGKQPIDIVITDINMPKMDGFEVIHHLRKIQAYDSVPILVLTTESDKEKKEKARGLGATGFIVKPFNPGTLIETIRKVSP